MWNCGLWKCNEEAQVMRKVVLSKRAATKLENLLAYLENEWSEKVKREFIKKLDRSFPQIQKYPNRWPKSEIVDGLHKLVVTKQTSVYYRFNFKTIQVEAHTGESDRVKNVLIFVVYLFSY